MMLCVCIVYLFPLLCSSFRQEFLRVCGVCLKCVFKLIEHELNTVFLVMSFIYETDISRPGQPKDNCFDVCERIHTCLKWVKVSYIRLWRPSPRNVMPNRKLPAVRGHEECNCFIAENRLNASRRLKNKNRILSKQESDITYRAIPKAKRMW